MEYNNWASLLFLISLFLKYVTHCVKKTFLLPFHVSAASLYTAELHTLDTDYEYVNTAPSSLSFLSQLGCSLFDLHAVLWSAVPSECLVSGEFQQLLMLSLWFHLLLLEVPKGFVATPCLCVCLSISFKTISIFHNLTIMNCGRSMSISADVLLLRVLWLLLGHLEILQGRPNKIWKSSACPGSVMGSAHQLDMNNNIPVGRHPAGILSGCSSRFRSVLFNVNKGGYYFNLLYLSTFCISSLWVWWV